jgi:hypothetical protein
VFFAVAVVVDVASILRESYKIFVEAPFTEWKTFAGFLNRRLEIVMLLDAPVIDTSVGRAYELFAANSKEKIHHTVGNM